MYEPAKKTMAPAKRFSKCFVLPLAEGMVRPTSFVETGHACNPHIGKSNKNLKNLYNARFD